MAALTAIDQAGASLGDTFNGRPIIAVQADGTYVYGSAVVVGVEVAALPTSFAINTVGGNNNANGFTTNGVYRGNNTGSITGSTFGNWTWRIRVRRIGDYIEQHYWNDTANTGFRESHNGGSTWSAWAV